MTVVDGCWVNFRYKKRQDELYFQVSGDMYNDSRYHLKNEHIAILESMEILKEEMSQDIFSRHFDPPRDFNQIATMVFKIFNEVYRVEDGVSAYIEYVLGTKDKDEFERIRNELEDYIPKRSDVKFKWTWKT